MLFMAVTVSENTNRSLLFDMESLPEPGAHRLDQTSWPASPSYKALGHAPEHSFLMALRYRSLSALQGLPAQVTRSIEPQSVPQRAGRDGGHRAEGQSSTSVVECL